MSRGRVAAVCIADRTGVPKHAVFEVELVENRGVAGDAHAGPGHRQVSLLAAEAVALMAAKLGRRLAPGAFGENVLVAGLDLCGVKVGDHVRLGPAEVEVTQIGKECHSRCAIYHAAGDCIMPREGVFGRVVRGGPLRAGDAAAVVAAPAPGGRGGGAGGDAGGDAGGRDGAE